eukprot:6197556-Pleurochrysis_carterae.AAC.1
MNSTVENQLDEETMMVPVRVVALRVVALRIVALRIEALHVEARWIRGWEGRRVRRQSNYWGRRRRSVDRCHRWR